MFLDKEKKQLNQNKCVKNTREKVLNIIETFF